MSMSMKNKEDWKLVWAVNTTEQTSKYWVSQFSNGPASVRFVSVVCH
jgi:hypothetical protein